MLTPDQQLRYARHLSLPQFGVAGQTRLQESSVLIVGAGGLGCPAALYLAAAGVGRLGIIDDDQVDLTNLQRQILHRTADIGRAKTASAEEALNAHNPDTQVVPIAARFDEQNARPLLRDYDLVLDAADNFPTRYLVNDAAVLEGKPVVHGSVYLYEGQVTIFNPPHGPCYRCMFPQPPAPGSVPSCAEAGVLGVLPGVIGMLQATEAIKLLTGLGAPLIGRILSYDALAMSFQTLKLKRQPSCPLCGEHPTITEARTITSSCAVDDPAIDQLDAAHYRALRQQGDPHLLLDVREPYEVAAGCLDDSLNIPLGELAERLAELAQYRDQLIVCFCKVGIRSQHAAVLLAENGFTRLANFSGGYLSYLADQSADQ